MRRLVLKAKNFYDMSVRCATKHEKGEKYGKDQKDKVGGFVYVGYVGIFVVMGIAFLPRQSKADGESGNGDGYHVNDFACRAGNGRGT